MQALFRIIKTPVRGRLDAEDFVSAVERLCVYSEDDLVFFAFEFLSKGLAAGLDNKYAVVEVASEAGGLLMHADSIVIQSLQRTFEQFQNALKSNDHMNAALLTELIHFSEDLPDSHPGKPPLKKVT